MRGGPVFLGVYAKAADLERDGEKNAARWHVWGLADGGFMLQEAPVESAAGSDSPDDTGAKRPGEPRRLSPDEFFLGYRVLAAFSPQKKNRNPEPEAPVIEDYTRDARSGGAKSAGKNDAADHPKSEAETKKRSDYNNLWASQDAPAGFPAKAAGAPGASAARAWLPPSDEADQGRIIVKGRSAKDEARPLARDWPEEAAKPSPAVGRPEVRRDGPGDVRPQVAETPPDADGPVDMSRAEIERIEEAFRTEFSLALIRLKGKRDEGIAALEKMAAHPGPFAVEHKFMFTDCGLALRKRNFYALANKYHERAHKLSPDDEHVLFNQARVMYESGRISKARDCLRLALDMVPAFAEARDFLDFIDGPNKR